MKKIFLLVLIFICLKSFGQYPNGVQTLGNDSNVITPKGAFRGRVINHAFTDTTSANVHRIRNYPGAQIYTTSDDKFRIRNAATTAWIEIGSGSGAISLISIASANGFSGSSSGGTTPVLTLSTSVTGLLKGNGTAISAAVAGTDYLTTAVTNFSAGDLSPLFTTSEATTTTTPALTFNLSNAGAYTVFGRGATVGTPSFLTSIDSNWIPHLHTEAYYIGKFGNPFNQVAVDTSTGHAIMTLTRVSGSFEIRDFGRLASAYGFGSGGANSLGTYIVQTATNAPANAQILASLATGIVKNTTTTGALSIATAGTDYLTPTGSAAGLTSFPTFNQNTTGSAATLTTPRNIQGVAFNGSANIDIINGTGFVKATGTTLSYDNSTYESALIFSTGLTRAVNTITSNLSTGISGGQSVIGGTGAGDDLTISSTSNGTKGNIFFGTSTYDEVNNRLGIGEAAPVGKLDVKGIAAMDLPTYGSELLSASGWTSTNWTGSFGAGWTHTTGNTTALTNTLAATSSTKYQIAFTVSGRTAGTFTVTFGGVTSGAYSATDAFGPTATSTGTLSIAPTTDFDGTIIISIKAITAVSTATVNIKSSDGTIVAEIRANNIASNTFYGVGAGRYNTTAIKNTVFGSNSFLQNTTGISNAAIGYNVLAVNSIGIANVGLGADALRANTTGSNNMGIGFQSLGAATTATDNVAVGLNALLSVTTGGSNVAIGSQAGRTLATSAGLNTFIGYSAGFNGSQLTSASNSTAIGNGAYTTASNQVVLGNTSITTGGIGVVGPTALWHLKAGSSSASTAPLKFTSGALNTTAEAGAVEFLTDAFYGTITTGAARKTFAFLQDPTFTGIPAAPTAAAATNTTQIATTAHVFAERANTATLTNKRITARYGSTASSATPTINTDNVDTYELTAQAADITSFTTNLSGTPATDDRLHIIITGTAARGIVWGASFESSTVALPSTTVGTDRLDIYFVRTAAGVWRCGGVH